MTDRQETIADIIAEMKREAAQIFPALPIAVLKLATRIEAAWKREREMTKPAGIVNSGAASDSRDNSGNCAKLREALVAIKALTEPHAHELSELGTVYRTAKAFLKGVGDGD